MRGDNEVREVEHWAQGEQDLARPKFSVRIVVGERRGEVGAATIGREERRGMSAWVRRDRVGATGADRRG